MTKEITRQVIVIDDDFSVRRSLHSLLMTLGYQVCLYDSAEDLLTQSLPQPPAVILLDMRMPGLSGVELQSKLKMLGLTMPIVFMSGESRPEEIIAAMKQGASDFLLKPFSEKQLQQALSNAMTLSEDAYRIEHTRQSVLKRLGKLTPRELEVCKLMQLGYKNSQISELTGAASSTIKLHRARVLEKMEVATLADLVEICKDVSLQEFATDSSHQSRLSHRR